MKKIIAWILCWILAVGCVSVAEENGAEDHLIVGSTTVMSGNFFSEMFGNNSSDMDVWPLIHGYGLICWNTEQGGFVTDKSVISGMSVSENAAGDRTYTLALYQDLYYSDGTPITAWDYAFSILLSASPEMAAIGASLIASQAILGVTEYMNGTANTISGVRVINDYLFSVTIKHEYRPFFFELGLINYYPYPVHVIAPDCIAADDGNGIYIGNRSAFTAELLQQTVLGEEGYLSHPSVTSGPYTLVSFDGVTAEFELNPWYKGNADGKKPTIPYLTFTLVKNADMIDQLKNGEVDLLNKCVCADTISAGIQAVGEEDISMTSYSRTGLSYISFCCEKTAVSSQKVRQAIAYCMDRESIVKDYVGNYGMVVDGYYGIGQWMYQLVNGTLPVPEEVPAEEATAEEWQAYQERLEAWNALSMDGLEKYAPDQQTAVTLLEEDGWTLNEQGGEFRPGQDAVRCKQIDGELVKLDLKLIYPAGNAIADALQTGLVEPLAEAGIRLTLEGVEMRKLLNYFYRTEERDMDMIYLATNFTTVYDPSLTYSPDSIAQSIYNTSAIQDEHLYELTVDMRKTEPGDLLTYCQKWVAFQEYWTEVLPAIPVYSNAYFDFYTSRLENYVITSNSTWTYAIVDAALGWEIELQAQDELFEAEDGAEIFD